MSNEAHEQAISARWIVTQAIRRLRDTQYKSQYYGLSRSQLDSRITDLADALRVAEIALGTVITYTDSSEGVPA